MVKFIYTDNLVPTEETAVDLLALAGIYNLDRMQSICMFFLEQNVTVENAVSLLEVGDWYEALHLKTFCISFIIKHLVYVFFTSRDTLALNISFRKIKASREWEEFKNRNPALFNHIIQMSQSS